MKWIVVLLLLSGCATHYSDNPRNMQNMTADQLRRELGAN